MTELNKQLSLFDILNEAPAETNRAGKKVIKGTVEPTKVEPPAILETISNAATLEDLVMSVNGIAGYSDKRALIAVKQTSRWNPLTAVGVIENNKVSQLNSYVYADDIPFLIYTGKSKMSYILLFVDDNGVPWGNEVEFNWQDYLGLDYLSNELKPNRCISFKLKKWKVYTKYPNLAKSLVINDEYSLWNILRKTNPYGYVFAKESRIEKPILMLTSPQLEQLSKAGFEFAERAYKGYLDDDGIECLNRLIQPGRKIKNIFKTTKDVYNVLKNESNLEIWDVYRKMAKTGKLGKDTIQQAYWRNFREDELTRINLILGFKYEGKSVFTWESLMNYLQRLDTFQAISSKEAFPLLHDYLRMCDTLEIKPRIDSDSLKREHDVTARTIREKRDEIMERKMKSACDYLKVNDYTEKTFFIRGIRDYADLIDEAKQQRNCVGGYGNAIINHQSLIYVMRETASPEKSLITVELNSDMNQIRQKYLACNQMIHNKAQTEFLERWLKLVKERKETKANSIMEMLKRNDDNKRSISQENMMYIPEYVKKYARELAAELNEFSKSSDPYGYKDNYDEHYTPVEQAYDILLINGDGLDKLSDDLKELAEENETFRDDTNNLLKKINLFKQMYYQSTKEQTEETFDSAFQFTGGRFLNLHLTDNGEWEYSLVDSDYTVLDGGWMGDISSYNMPQVVDEIMAFHGIINEYPVEVDRDELQDRIYENNFGEEVANKLRNISRR